MSPQDPPASPEPPRQGPPAAHPARRRRRKRPSLADALAARLGPGEGLEDPSALLPPDQRHQPKPRPRRDAPTGQIPKLTPEVERRICDAIAATSCSFEDACHLAGIHPGTGRQWLQRGTTDPGDKKHRPPHPRYVAFVDAIAQARARDKASRVARMTQAAIGGYEVSRETITRPDGTKIERVRKQPPDWRADESILERRYPAEFGRRVILDHEGAQPAVDWAGMVQDAWAMIRAEQARRVGAGSTSAGALPPAAAANDSRRNGDTPP